MTFIEALALVFSKRRRIEHGAWQSWAIDRLDHLRTEASRTDEYASGGSGGDGDSERPRGTSSRDLRDEYAEFIANGGGRK